MGEETRGRRVHERWAHLRFSVVGQLLAAPPDEGELKAAIEGLADRRHAQGAEGEEGRRLNGTTSHEYRGDTGGKT